MTQGYVSCAYLYCPVVGWKTSSSGKVLASSAKKVPGIDSILTDHSVFLPTNGTAPLLAPHKLDERSSLKFHLSKST